MASYNYFEGTVGIWLPDISGNWIVNIFGFRMVHGPDHLKTEQWLAQVVNVKNVFFIYKTT